MKTVALVALAATALSVLLVLEAGKDAHRDAGLHLPSEQERCYMQPTCVRDGQ